MTRTALPLTRLSQEMGAPPPQDVGANAARARWAEPGPEAAPRGAPVGQSRPQPAGRSCFQINEPCGPKPRAAAVLRPLQAQRPLLTGLRHFVTCI